MSPANAKDHARCTSRGCGGRKGSALSVRHGRWRRIEPRSAACRQGAAAVGGDRGLMRGVRVRPGAPGGRPGGKGQVAWLQPLEGRYVAEIRSGYAAWWQHSSLLFSRPARRELVCLPAFHEYRRVNTRGAMPAAGSISAVRWRCGSWINSLFFRVCRQVGRRNSRGHAGTWRHNSKEKLRTVAVKSSVFSRLRDSETRGFAVVMPPPGSIAAATRQKGCGLSNAFSVVPARLANRCQMVFRLLAPVESKVRRQETEGI